MHFHLNLASRQYLDRRSVRRWLWLVGGVLSILLAVNLVYAWRNLQQLRQVDVRLAELDERLAAQRGRAATGYSPENHARLMERIGVANQLIDADRFRWSALLGRLEELLPADVAIRTLKPNYRDRSLQIAAVARDTAALRELLDALLASAELNQVYLLNQSLLEQQNGETVVQFSLVVREAF